MNTQKPIIALDFDHQDQAREFLKFFNQQKLNLKIGMEMFYHYGPQWISEIQAQGHEIFLDLKLHDIPHTVYRAMKQLSQLQVSMVTVHASGGSRMLEAAKEGLLAGCQKAGRAPLLVAVTHLTSTDQTMLSQELLVNTPLEDAIKHLAQLSQGAGLDGVVCSAQEAALIKAATGPSFLTVTPGIRPQGFQSDHEDQVRIMTPKAAAQRGSNYIVVGRPIFQAPDPYLAYQTIKTDWQAGLKERREEV
ncbi:orotidine-5'-phosphate decarboxylase [Eremococcus coleocola]|uniref:orotidine-5'-phosphate decarboxylase n=1 Tax=Eremococcus coleocola TaxID=88132 RepID=UPI00042312E4|nr:orotidine-5'-phosphate decarboxylase [Eremococcus coleocola]